METMGWHSQIWKLPQSSVLHLADLIVDDMVWSMRLAHSNLQINLHILYYIRFAGAVYEYAFQRVLWWRADVLRRNSSLDAL